MQPSLFTQTLSAATPTHHPLHLHHPTTLPAPTKAMFLSPTPNNDEETSNHHQKTPTTTPNHTNDTYLQDHYGEASPTQGEEADHHPARTKTVTNVPVQPDWTFSHPQKAGPPYPWDQHRTGRPPGKPPSSTYYHTSATDQSPARGTSTEPTATTKGINR